MRDTGKTSPLPSHFFPYVHATVVDIAIVLKALLKLYKLMLKKKNSNVFLERGMMEDNQPLTP